MTRFSTSTTAATAAAGILTLRKRPDTLLELEWQKRPEAS